jgi:hypothetical protein
MIEIAWARRKSDGRIVGVDQVPNGLACECVCTKCERALVAAQGDINRHHFRHYADDTGSPCGGGQETALHQLAKTIVTEAASIYLPGNEMRDILSAELEPTRGEVRPDVIIVTPLGPVAIEIAVEHRTGDTKIARLVAMALPAVEIDISVYRGVLLSSEELKEVVLSTAVRRWLKPRKEREKPPGQRPASNRVKHYKNDAEVDWAAFDALREELDSAPVPEPEPARIEAPAPAIAFMHYCHCGRWGAFGYGVDLLNGKLGRWYCTEHRRELLNRMVVP